MAPSTYPFSSIIILAFIVFLLATASFSEALHSSHTSSHARKSLNSRRRDLEERERRNTLPLNRRQDLIDDLGNDLGGVVGGLLDGLGLGEYFGFKKLICASCIPITAYEARKLLASFAEA